MEHSKTKKPKTVLLFSGGLDSILAFKILKEQGIKIYPVFFDFYFIDKNKPRKWAEIYKIPLEIINLKKKQLKVVKNPTYGYGKNLNPCLDCKILMLKEAKKLMRKRKADFIATGEVVNQRPFSQKKWALNLIEKESGLEGKILRPLSAKILKPTEAERNKLAKREKLFSIKGRGRGKQMTLAKEYGLDKYPSPAGGCLLTEPSFCLRLKEYFKRGIVLDGREIELLKLGRHFFFNKGKIVVGRSQEENEKIKKLKKRNDILIEMQNYPGPTTLVRFYRKLGKASSKEKDEIIKKAKELTKFYSLKSRNQKEVKFKIETGRTQRSKIKRKKIRNYGEIFYD